MVIGIYFPVYMVNNSPICKQEGVVEEIVSISGIEAKIKLSDGTIKNQKIEKYDNTTNKFKSYLKVNEAVCLEYKNPLDYYLAYIIK